MMRIHSRIWAKSYRIIDFDRFQKPQRFFWEYKVLKLHMVSRDGSDNYDFFRDWNGGLNALNETHIAVGNRYALNDISREDWKW